MGSLPVDFIGKWTEYARHVDSVHLPAVDGAGCVLGAPVFTGLGYLVCGSAMVLLGRVRRIEFWLLGALVAGVTLVVIIHRTAKRELHIEDGDDTAG